MKAVLRRIGVGVFGIVIYAAPAIGMPVVYTSFMAFNAANPDAVTFTQSYPTGVTSKTPGFSQGPVTFHSAGLNAYNDGTYGTGISYIGAYLANPLTIASSSDAFGFSFGSYAGAQTVSFLVNGVPGSFALGDGRQLSFLGFSSGGGPITVSFTQTAELDVVGSFVATTAIAPVAEPAVWAMLLVGFGVCGTSLRYSRKERASSQSCLVRFHL